MHGPNIKANKKIQGCRTIDIVPTILHLMNEAIPEYMDGRVLTDAIETDFTINNPIKYISETSAVAYTGMQLSEKDEKEISAKLKALGYIE